MTTNLACGEESGSVLRRNLYDLVLVHKLYALNIDMPMRSNVMGVDCDEGDEKHVPSDSILD